MRKGHCLSVLLIAVFWVIFVASMQAGPLGSFASAGAGYAPVSSGCLPG